ncbi:MAG TPA: hypothetical protein VFX59_21655 [Polyangiales bacterium]|nr:hypothetical protein [Polyangiales bacterium]
MAEPNDNDREVNNKIARDAMMRAGSSLTTIAAYREQVEAAARNAERDAIVAYLGRIADYDAKTRGTQYDECCLTSLVDALRDEADNISGNEHRRGGK